MKITKDYLKRIIKEEMKKVLKEQENSKKDEFLNAIRQIQEVLRKHGLDASGTYSDGYNDYDPYDAIKNYNQTLPKVLNDPEYTKAKDTLLGLKVSYRPDFYPDSDPNKYFEIVDVYIPEFSEGGASDDVYLSLADPDELETRGRRKGKPRIVNSIMIDEEYTNAKDMIQDARAINQ